MILPGIGGEEFAVVLKNAWKKRKSSGEFRETVAGRKGCMGAGN